MTGFDNHKVVTSRDLWEWLHNLLGENITSVWKQGNPTLITLRKKDIIDSIWAIYSPDENTTGIYISGYSVGDGKSGYTDNQNVIAADIEYREAEVTPEPSDRVFKVFLQGDPDETNKGYFASNNTGETVTFVVRTNVPIEDIPIVISGSSATHTTPTSAVFDSESDYYYYTFDVELTTVNSGNNTIGEVFSVTQGTASSDVVVYIPGTVEGTAGLLYTSMPYVYTVNGESGSPQHTWENGGYTTTNSSSYSFIANLGTGGGEKSITFPPSTAIHSDRVSTGSEILGVTDVNEIRNGFKINQPVVFRLNVGRRTFTSKSSETGQTIKVGPDSTVLFAMSMTPDQTTSYDQPYPQYFVTSGTDIALDSTFGLGGDNAGVYNNDGSLLAKLADSGDIGTLTIKGKDVTGSASGTDWWQYGGYSQNYDVYNIDKLYNVTLNNAGNFRIVAHRQNGTTLRLVIAGNGSGNTYPRGYHNFIAYFGDTITGTIDGANVTLNIIRPKHGAYRQSCVYVDIPNYNSASSYTINIPSDQSDLLENQTLCYLAYSFGSGVKCLDPDSITTRLWKPNMEYRPIPIYGNLSQIKLCDVYVRDGNVPKCEKSYVKFRMVDDSKELILYEAYVDDIIGILDELDPNITLLIHIYSIYDSSAKRQDEFDPGATIINGFYSVSNKSYILASVTMDGDTPHVTFCTTDGYYSKGNPVAQSTVAVETFDVASQYFDNANTTMFNIGGNDGYAGRGVLDGFVELAAGSNINIIGTMHAIDMSSPFDDEEP